jgi:hypothetical protein
MRRLEWCASAVALTLVGAESHSGLLLAANKGDHTLSVIDPETGRTLSIVPETAAAS